MIICVEDDANIRELEIYTLRSVGYDALGVTGSKELFKLMENMRPRLIILDLMLPGEDGLSIMKRLRADAAFKDVPVIMATAKDSEFDKVRGLDSGADDYLTKPFGMMEMVSRVKAVLRRVEKNGTTQTFLLTFGDLKVDLMAYKVYVHGEEVVLTLKEFQVLQLLLQHPGQVYTRDQLLNAVWGYDYSGETRTVDVHIRTLRQKLGTCGDLVETVRGVGYRFQSAK
jgi:two-component system alkaline phosphatase synthesis response regulator PhoP